MKGLVLIAAVACLATPAMVRAQSVKVGERVRVSLTDHVLPSPYARTGKLRTVVGTVRAIEPDTIRLETSASDAALALPRILIYTVERSLGKGRLDSTKDAAMGGFGLGAVVMGFFSEKTKATVVGIGAAVGALFGAVHPYERWEFAWFPE
jgi:hypothetical protein